MELAVELEVKDELRPSDSSRRRLYVYSNGRLRRFPDVSAAGASALWAIATSGLLSLRGKARLAMEPFISAQEGDADESLGSFIRRRLGQEALDKMAGPLLAGLYAAQADALSLQSTFPDLRRLERQGGLVRALLKPRPKTQNGQAPARRASFMTLTGGLSRLCETLSSRLPDETLRTGAPVQAIRRGAQLWEIETPAGSFSASAVIATLPAPALARLVSGFDGELSSALADIPVETTATVSLAFPKGALSIDLNAFGFLVAPLERGLVTAATYASSKFPGRAADDGVVVRCFLVGQAGRRIENLSEQELITAALSELQNILKVKSLAPRSARVYKWVAAIPQYAVGHEERLWRIENRLEQHQGLFVAGCYYRGVGLPECIRQAKAASQRTLEFLG
jgi:oxygen-dependent protoporphyrinogen oxidase